MSPIGFDPRDIAASVIRAVIEAFLDIFFQAGSESIRRAIETVLSAATPDITSDWFITTYVVLFGLGTALAIGASLMRSLAAVWSSDSYRFFTVWKHNLLHYVTGLLLPAVYLFLHLLFVRVAQAMADSFGLTESTAVNIDMAIGSVESRLLVGLVGWGLGGLLELQVWFLITFFPVVVLLFGVFITGLSEIDGKRGGKIWSVYFAMLVTSLLSILVYVIWFGIGGRIVQSGEGTAVDAASLWGSTLVILLSFLTPFFVWFAVYKRINHVITTNAARVNAQLSGVAQTRSIGGASSTNKSNGPKQRPSGATRVASAADRANHVSKKREIERKNMDSADRIGAVASLEAGRAARKAAARSAAGKSALGATATGGAAAAVSILATRRAKRNDKRSQAQSGNP